MTPEAATPEVQDLKGLLQVQTGSVVSRTLIKKPTGTVTAFAFDAGEGLSEHSAPYDALVLGLDGEAEIRIDGAPYRVAGGQLLLLPAQHPHAVRALSPFKMMLVMIREPRDSGAAPAA